MKKLYSQQHLDNPLDFWNSERRKVKKSFKGFICFGILFSIIFCTLYISVSAISTNETDLDQSTSSIAASSIASISDVGGHWAEKDIQEWFAQGFINGYKDCSFRPDQRITRAEFITIVNRALSLKNESNQSFADIKSTDWYYASFKKAMHIGYITGYNDGTARPENYISRQEAADIIAGLLRINEPRNISEINDFTDSAAIPGWSMASVNAVVKWGYFKGYPDKTFRAEAPITRAETVTLLKRALGTIVQEGTFGPDVGIQTIKGNLTVNNSEIKLKNLIIEGDLYCTAGIGDGTAYIENCKIEGRTIISGGGEHSVIFTNTTSSVIIIYKTDGIVRIVASNDSSLQKTRMETPAILEEDNLTAEGFESVEIITINPGENIELNGNYQSITINSQVNIAINGTTTINSIYLSEEAEGTVIDIAKQAVIENITIDAAAQVIGSGNVISATINANKVSIEQPVQNLSMGQNVQSAIVGGKTVTGTYQDSQSNSNNDNNHSGGTANSAPTALSDSSFTTKNNSVMIDVLANDSDPDGNTLSIISFTQGGYGSVVQEVGGNRLNYTPETDFTGNDSFSYAISDGNGGTATATVNIAVSAPVPDAPIASFTCDTTSGDAPLAVTFTNTSTGSVDSFAWDFNGDGTSDNTSDNTATFTFNTPGTYNATLTVVNAGGSNTASIAITVNTPLPEVPVANFTCDTTSGDAPLAVTFTNTSTGSVDSFAWDFNGDGTSDNTSDNTATFTFNTPGTYNAKLAVINAGGSNTASIAITVNTPLPEVPVASFTCDTTSGDAPLTVTFTNTSTGSIDSFAWDFNGDGTSDNTSDNTATFTFNTSGTYNVKLTVINAGGSDTSNITITVNTPLPEAPIASFTGNPTTGDAPLTVTFTNTSTGGVDSFAWDFNGDGTSDNTSDNTATYTFEFAGTYNATLTVTNAGGSNSTSIVITVNTPVPEAPIASFTGNPTTGDAPLTVTFTNTSTGSIDSFAWDFNGDGTADNTSDNTATFTFDTPGTYNASLTVTNAGGSDTSSIAITVNTPVPEAPVASFTGNPTTGDAPLTVTFTNTSTGSIDSFAWDFNGDGTADNTSDNTATYTFEFAGTYNATLTVTNAGGSNSTSIMITVNTPVPVAPVASFTGNPTTGDAPLTVTFTNTSTGSIDSFAWDFNGDGTADNTSDNTATYTFESPGTYNATLTVTNAGGSDSISCTITVS